MRCRRAHITEYRDSLSPQFYEVEIEEPFMPGRYVEHGSRMTHLMGLQAGDGDMKAGYCSLSWNVSSAPEVTGSINETAPL